MILGHIYMSKTHKIVNPALFQITFCTIRFTFYTKTLNIYLFFSVWRDSKWYLLFLNFCYYCLIFSSCAYIITQ